MDTDFPAIAQEHSLGCSVACVASRCRWTYIRALELFPCEEFAWLRGYFCDEVVLALERAGLRYQFAQFRPEDHSPLLSTPGTMVFVRPNERLPAGHYLLRTTGGWMNPWINFPFIAPAQAGYTNSLPGEPSHILFERSC